MAETHYPFPEPEMNVSPYEAKVIIRRSESIGKLVESLAKAQLKYTKIKKSVENTFYTTEKKRAMYADLAAVIDATQPALASEGLVIIQHPIIRSQERSAGVLSVLAHSSGEWYENETVLPATAKIKEYQDGGKFNWGLKFDAQTCGIAITYSRRYSWQSLAGVAAEEDDDGNSIGEPSGGSKEAALSVAKKKLTDKGVVQSLFYVWFDESQTAEITGSEELKTANKDILKKLWSPVAGAIVANGEQLEALKYELEKRGVPFAPLKAK